MTVQLRVIIFSLKGKEGKTNSEVYKNVYSVQR